MNKYVIYGYILTLITIQCVKSADEYANNATDDEGEEEGNFEVTETTGQPQPSQLLPQTEHVQQPQPVQQYGQYPTYHYAQYPGYSTQQPQYYHGYQQPQPYYYPGYQQPYYYPGYQPQHYYYPGYQVTQPPQQPAPVQPYQVYGPYQPQPIPTQPQPVPVQPAVVQEPYQVPPVTQPEDGTTPSQEVYNIPVIVSGISKPQKYKAKQPSHVYIKDTKVKPYGEKKCNVIKYFKIDNQGQLVEMSEGDYYKSADDNNRTKYRFNSKLEHIWCDGETIFMHIPGTKHATSLTYHKRNNVYIVRFDDRFLMIKNHKWKWVVNSRIIPTYVKMFKEGKGKKYVELTNMDYYVNLSLSGYVKFIFSPHVKCTKVTIKGQVIWEETEGCDYPKGLSITSGRNLVMYFVGYLQVYGARGDKKTYKLITTKQTYETIDYE